jgi:pimeloyl-ACP methyl ester carboxylesterase
VARNVSVAVLYLLFAFPDSLRTSSSIQTACRSGMWTNAPIILLHGLPASPASFRKSQIASVSPFRCTDLWGWGHPTPAGRRTTGDDKAGERPARQLATTGLPTRA